MPWSRRTHQHREKTRDIRPAGLTRELGEGPNNDQLLPTSDSELGVRPRRRRRRSHSHERQDDPRRAIIGIWIIILSLVGGGVFWFVSEASPKRGVIDIPGIDLPDELLPSLIRPKAPTAKDAPANNRYSNGQGAPQDYVEVVKRYRLAADQGDAFAQYNLGYMYSNGQGVPQDYVEAHKWYNLAASRYRASEKEQRELAVKNRELLASKMTPAQIAEAQKLAREWKPQ